MLESGLSSELFLLAYAYPNSGYKYAQIIQNTAKMPNTSKIYPILQELKDKDYLILKNDKYYPNTVRLFEEITKHLSKNKYEFSETELKHIKNIALNREFFLFLLPDVIDLIQNQEKRVHNINALEYICEKIGYFASSYLLLKSHFPDIGKINHQNTEYYKSIEQISTELDDSLLEITEKMSKSIGGRKSIKKKKMKTVDLLSQSIKALILYNVIFSKIPDETIKKISTMWKQTGGFDIAIDLFEFIQKVPKDFSFENYEIVIDEHLNK